MSHSRNQLIINSSLVLGLCLVLSLVAVGASSLVAQETLPAPPADRTLIYVKSEKGELVPLPFEAGTTPLNTDAVARSDKMSRVELKGESAGTAIASESPRFYLFVQDRPDVHPPLLVRLTPKRGVRRVTVVAQKGQRGFAVASEEIVKPYYRVIKREGGMIYMEVWAREPLMPGEYAFVGSDLARVATFRVTSSSTL